MERIRKVLYTREEVNSLFEKENCCIYGAGKVAKTIVKYAANENYAIENVVVSSLEGNATDVLGVQVVELDDMKSKSQQYVLVVCLMEKSHQEIEERLEHTNFKDVYYISDSLFREVTYSMGNYEIENAQQLRTLYSQMVKRMDQHLKKTMELESKINKQKNDILKFTPRPCLEYVIINIVDHCNLKCKGCDHFACVADPYYVKFETIKNDVERLGKIFRNDYISQIAVMGGEPLLHPDLLNILKVVRDNFPYSTIRLTTNGLLLLNQDDTFWRVCRENDITIVNTKYPINLDFDAMKERAKRESVEFMYFEGTGDATVKTSFKKFINLKGNSNPVESFSNCHISNYGNFVMEGKFYGCPFICQSYRIFNEKFNQKLHITEKDYLDIYKVNDMQEIFDFCAKPKPYCRYCTGKSEGFEWTRSKQNIEEWLDVNL